MAILFLRSKKCQKPIKSNNDAQNGAHNVRACNCPASEMLRPEEEIDISNIDEMLIKMGMMDDVAPDSKAAYETTHERILRMVDNVNLQLEDNIKLLKEGTYDANISNEVLIEFLENFKNYSKVMGQYLNKMK